MILSTVIHPWTWNLYFSCHFQHFLSLLYGLRKDPDILRGNLKRSKSLCDLTTLEEVGALSVFVRYKPIETDYYGGSCPNLSELQSVQTMHPKLYHQLTENLQVPQSNLHSFYGKKTAALLFFGKDDSTSS